MNTTNSAITVLQDKTKSAIIMRYEKDARDDDVKSAYQQVKDMLDRADKAQFIIIDLSACSATPIAVTLIGALHSPNKHPMLNQWLIVGRHHAGQMLARILARTMQKETVIWFNIMSEVDRHIENEMQCVSRD